MELDKMGLTEEQLSNIQKLIQSETDKVRTDYSTKLKTANDELLKYKPADKTEEEKSYDQKLMALEKREKELASKEMASKLKDKLSEKGLPDELAQYLNVGDDLEKFVNDFSGTVNNILLGNGFKPSEHKNSTGITKEQFKNMTYSERAKLSDEKPELYKTLSQE
jgi:hypothetical protein